MKETILILGVILFGATSFYWGANTRNRELARLAERAKVQTQCHALYSEFVHELWIEHPQIVEEAMEKSEYFQKLITLKEGDFEDEYVFWDTQDSIDYYKNGGTKGELF